MEPRIFKYILRYSLNNQIQVIVLTLLSFPILYSALELPKIIINDALGAVTDTITFLGQTFSAEAFLLILCAIYLFLIVGSGLLKMRINTLKGVIGERLVRRLRFQLTDRILRFPPKHFHRVSQGELIATVTAEAEPLAGFIGDSIALPLLQGGTMLTILVFMFMQNPILGFASIMLIPVQLVIIPRLQRHINELKKQRVKVVRHFSERIGEAVDGAIDIRTHGTERYHQAEFSSILGQLFKIRFEIFQRKFFMKFLNNFINSLTPIMFYSIGGILAIRGEITVGALVAAIAAHKELTDPWRELLNYYQNYQDALIRYGQILNRFQSDDLAPEIDFEVPHYPADKRLSGDLIFRDAWLLNDAGERFLHARSVRFKPGGLIYVQADKTSQCRSLSFAIMQLQPQKNGAVCLGDQPLDNIPHALLNRRITYAGPDAFLFNENVAQNINYGLRQHPPEYIDNKETHAERKESAASGNSEDCFDGVWTDFSINGIETWNDMRPWFEACIYAVGSGPVLYRLGLQEYFRPENIEQQQDFARHFLEVRHHIKAKLHPHLDYPPLHRLDAGQFCPALMMLDNICFALNDAPEQTAARLAESEQMIDFLKTAGLFDVAIAGGTKLAKDIYRELSVIEPSEALPVEFSRFDLPDIREALLGYFKTGIEDAYGRCDECLLLVLFFRSCLRSTIAPYITDDIQQRIIAARSLIREPQWQNLLNGMTELNENEMNPHLTVLENVLFSILEEPQSEEHEWLHNHIERIMVELDARSLVLIVFSMSRVGIRGSRLPLTARQKVQLARGLIKKPDILLLHDALSALDDDEQDEIIRSIRQLLPELTIINMGARSELPAEYTQRFRVVEHELIEQPLSHPARTHS